ncbi:MAG: hypothetical protein KF852_17435 [Saprospiraceae bacterium]|nr:hypothetical protein [Saprospiraceae bacterium]
MPAGSLEQHTRLRVEAMLLRDRKGDAVEEEDWKEITRLLEQSWTALQEALH